MTEIIDDIKARSRAFVDSLDRSALSVHAIDIEGLYLCDVVHRCEAMPLPHDELMLLNTALADSELYQHARASEFSNMDYHSELLFWWGTSDDAGQRGYFNTPSAQAFAPTFTPYFRHVYPEVMHSYFTMGIFDLDLINRLIADDVDAELAFSLVDA